MRMINLDLPSKALLIREPWVDLILSGQKTWEMRSSMTKFRGKFCIAKSGSGLLVGEATLVDCFLTTPTQRSVDYISKHGVSSVDLLSKWSFAWVLSDVIRYDCPIAYEHPQGAVIWVNLK